ncbi:MAG: hypothetical protein ACI9K2_000745 [Myxococcota bacterium]|jgi:hypothetical protein
MPGPDDAVIHVHTAEGQLGPYSRRQLAEQVESGALTTAAHIWSDGMSGWERLGDHPGFLEDLGEPGGVVPRHADESDDDYQDRLFGELVKASWDYLEDHNFAGHIDEVFLGAVITSTLDTGCSLIDLTSDGSHHYLRFEDLSDNSRVIFRMTHLTGSLAVSKVLGQRASVVIGYGERIGNVGKIMNALRSEMQSGYLRNPEPGTITVDGDLQSGYVYVQVDLYMNIDDYVTRDYRVDYSRLAGHIGATKHALRKYLRGRFG